MDHSSMQKTRYFLLFLILMAGVVLRFTTPLTTIFDTDSTGYIAPALNFILSGHFDRIAGRSYPYPLFLLPILSFFKNINAVCIIQHILGLGSVAAFIIFLECTYQRYIKNRSRALAFTALSVCFAALSALNPSIIIFEKMLRPEGIIMPCIFSILILLYSYFQLSGAKRGMVLYSICILILAFFSLLHPRMGSAFVFMAVLVLIYEIKLRGKQYTAVILLFTGLFAAVMLPEISLVKKYGQTSQEFTYRQFFYSNAKTVLKAINEGHTVIDSFDKKLMKHDIELVAIQNRDPTRFSILEYDVEALQHELGGPHLDRLIL